MTKNIIPPPRTGQESADTERRVVVGVDGSAASVRALMWAMEFAESYGVTVEAVTAWPLHAPVFIGEVPGHFNDARWQAVQAQNQAIEHAHGLLPRDSQHVARRIVNEGPLDALLDAAGEADLIILGAKQTYPSDQADRQALAEVLQVAAPCPVLEVSTLGVVSLPWGQHAFTTVAQSSQSQTEPASALTPA